MAKLRQRFVVALRRGSSSAGASQSGSIGQSELSGMYPNAAAIPRPHTRWAWMVATFFTVGRVSPGPGTWGSLAALLLWWLLAAVAHLSHIQLAIATLLLAVAAVVAGVRAGTIVASESRSEDPQFVVIDEVAGQWIALIPAAWGSWKLAVLAFFLFRLFDIWKPPPARQLERLHGGMGIVMDDVAAGIYAAILVALVAWMWTGRI